MSPMFVLPALCLITENHFRRRDISFSIYYHTYIFIENLSHRGNSVEKMNDWVT